MDIKSYFADKLSKLLFLEISKENIKKIFNVELSEEIYIPVKSDSIVNQVKAEESVDQIPLSFFIEGIIYVLGADKSFRFNEEYKNILKHINNSDKFIKGRIAEKVKNKNYEDAYILLKGLLEIDSSIEILDKLILIVDELRNKDKMYKEEELEIIEKAKDNENYATPYFYEAIMRKEERDYEKALFCINNYISRGGEETIEVTELKESLKLVISYEEGKKLVYNHPKNALKVLLPLLSEFGNDAALYYYIAVCYRILENYEKAIYYLNESMSIDNNIVEVVNELGINYASIGDYKNAIAYLRKAFEVTKSVEICTNLIMCYLNDGDIENARIHLDIAKKLDSKDEIVVQLENILGNI
ncbi:M48 family metallopeptidase [Clostridium sp. DJ247]|uniref:tetratricopeptide repeat protein n=1 Tax=Clostridium sp. DJ247 TaxID=2726188 RepID=UPI0016272DA4|nr:tetratricopeptide repeat protein [Clostridium sp. DJ247]MBC2580254.1 tetratricopeptide repeat protein [Clostridium sp. DJ247]